MLLFKTKKRLRAIRQRTEAQLAKLKKIGKPLFFTDTISTEEHTEMEVALKWRRKGIGPVSAGSIQIKERQSRETAEE